MTCFLEGISSKIYFIEIIFTTIAKNHNKVAIINQLVSIKYNQITHQTRPVIDDNDLEMWNDLDCKIKSLNFSFLIIQIKL